MNYIGKVLSNVREFYNDINAATLTGAIDVVVVEQPDGSFTCSPFHVRFGKMGVLRSREKVVDIEVNGEALDIHMKLGESGEAFFVEELSSLELENFPAHLACSPIPSDGEQLMMEKLGHKLPISPLARIAPSEFKDNRTPEKDDDSPIPPLSPLHEAHELAGGENASPVPKTFRAEMVGDDNAKSMEFRPIHKPGNSASQDEETGSELGSGQNNGANGGSKNSRRKRRRKSLLKKKQQQTKKSSPNNQDDDDDNDGGKESHSSSVTPPPMMSTDNNMDLGDEIQFELEDVNINSGKRSSPCSLHLGGIMLSGTGSSAEVTYSRDCSKCAETCSDLGLSVSSNSSSTAALLSDEIKHKPADLHFFSDTEATPGCSPNGSRPGSPTPQSDSELELQRQSSAAEPTQLEAQLQAELVAGGKQSWKWGELPSPPPQPPRILSNEEESESQESGQEGTSKEEDAESGKGPSVPQSPHSVEGAIGGPKFMDSDFEDSKTPDKLFSDLALSLCGPLDLSNPPSEEVFSQATISYAELRQNPTMLETPALVVRINGKLRTWKDAAPEVMSLLLFQQPLAMGKEDATGKLSDEAIISGNAENEASTENANDSNVVEEPQRYSWFSWRRSGSVSKKSDLSPQANSATAGRLPNMYRSSDDEELTEIAGQSVPKDDIIKEGGGYSGSNSSDESDSNGIAIPGAPRLRLLGKDNIVYRKTLRLSSDQIGSLQLKEGANEVVFSVTTAYQGTTRCKCHVYRWRWDDKIVISDIDGTITKSDVLGHILPVLGKDWAQSGVAQLFTKIKNNGYRLLYLSARAIGQARVTREYLKSIKQGDLSLPEGPLLLNPTSLISALHREVIEKKPEEFKISCLRDIQALFPYDCKPFYAGYGNKINDVWAYRAVGIPIFRIFTINHRGELKHELTQTFQSSYSNMSYIVDQMFPPPAENKTATEDFNSFNFWRDPIPELDPSLIPESPVTPKGNKTPVKESPKPKLSAAAAI